MLRGDFVLEPEGESFLGGEAGRAGLHVHRLVFGIVAGAPD